MNPGGSPGWPALLINGAEHAQMIVGHEESSWLGKSSSSASSSNTTTAVRVGPSGECTRNV
jgi:hypothetical protein